MRIRVSGLTGERPRLDPTALPDNAATRATNAGLDNGVLAPMNGLAVQDYFGASVALASDGNQALIGAYLQDIDGQSDAGALYTFSRSGDLWTQTNKLKASDLAIHDRFGFSVSLSSDVSTAIIGAHYRSLGGSSNNGGVYIFTTT